MNDVARYVNSKRYSFYDIVADERYIQPMEEK